MSREAKQKEANLVSDGMQRFNAIRSSTNVVYSLVFILLAFLCVVPVVFVIIISFSSEASIGQVGYSFHPVEWSINAYQYVWNLKNSAGVPLVVLAFFTSIGITLVGTTIGLTLISTMGYVLSRRSFRLRGLYTIIIFIPMIFSGGLLSTYVVNTQLLSLRNTYWALILPLAITTWNMIILKTAFQSVPDSLVESARLDGASELTTLVRVILPVTKASIAVITMYYVVNEWNAWFKAAIYLPAKHEYFPLQLVLRELLITNAGMSGTSLGEATGIASVETLLLQEVTQYAVIVISTLPIIIVYPFAQKYFVKGVMMGSVKG